MKKLLIALLLLALAAPAVAESDVLVACFSCTGRTWTLAEYAADVLGADLIRIEPVEPYTDEDLDYTDDDSRANREMADDACRPALAATVENMAQYTTVVIASPIWWGQAPRIIESFLDAHDLSGKTLLHFCTSGSSGYGRTGEILAAHTDDTVTWLLGDRLPADTTRDGMAAWLAGRGLSAK